MLLPRNIQCTVGGGLPLARQLRTALLPFVTASKGVGLIVTS